MKINKTLLLALALFIVCLPATRGVAAQMALPPAQTEYIIGEGDLLRITVYDNPDLTLETRVTAEGSITFPLIGEVVLKDLTAPGAEKKIAGLLANGYIIKPQVSVFIEESKGTFVYVNGEVKNPGAYRITKGLTVLKAITLAGGNTPKAEEKRANIVRKTAKGEITLKAKMDDLVQPDDLIYVPESMF